MKRLLLPFLIALFCLNFSGRLKAQPTLTAVDLAKQAGEQYLMAQFNEPPFPQSSYSYMFFSSPVVGPNQTWNYSAFTPANSYTISVLNRNTAPFSNAFPAATMVEKKGGRYEYLQNAGNRITNLGAVSITPYDTSKWEYDIPYDEMRFPVTTTTTYTDSFSYKVPGYYNNVCTAINYFTFETVGYGTLITPLGTFNSAVLVKTIRQLKPDTCGPLFGHSKTTEYKWYAPGFHQPLVCFTKAEALLGEFFSGYYLQANITGRREEQIANALLQTFPNPATSEVTIQYHLNTLSETSLTVTDALGKDMLLREEGTRAPGNYSHKFDVRNLPKGVYLVRLKTADQVAVKKLLVQ
ncbi:T9SS type A sorting domain-containing protein [Adhaeribacter sp. BT258]|uniref:T9SS type A sorting domain-containing protein n=1 Tax=Adhaeribacter terrigena TaxID=2793070 RepID=A0ABS1C5H2_9BACT|nr:T9SS type A sorting domain-containing protein [Adhaeribacter terrigena]MBK0404437.1 T9SS type A sorting domain-containing protein [Adhaeribacter terrigena]